MKNTYLTSYFPLLSIILFSISFSINMERIMLNFLKKTGIYEGMIEFFSDTGIKLLLLALFFILFFMIFAALKLIADTINELSLLFFSQDSEGENLKQIRFGSVIYFFGAALSLFTIFSLVGTTIILFVATISYLIYFVYKISASLTIGGTIGLVFFQVIVWAILITGVAFVFIKGYNMVMTSLPL